MCKSLHMLSAGLQVISLAIMCAACVGCHRHICRPHVPTQVPLKVSARLMSCHVRPSCVSNQLHHHWRDLRIQPFCDLPAVGEAALIPCKLLAPTGPDVARLLLPVKPPATAPMSEVS
jgi:hypothetical protein